jgi:phospholipase D1/2
VEELSGVSFYQAQVALARLWVGDPSLVDQKEVSLRVVEPTSEGLLISDKSNPKIETVPIPESEEQARETIERFEQAARQIRSDENVADSVAQHMLRDLTSLVDEQWEGTEEEELQSSVSFLLLWALLTENRDEAMYPSCFISIANL